MVTDAFRPKHQFFGFCGSSFESNVTISFLHGRSSGGIVHKDVVLDLRLAASRVVSWSFSCWPSAMVSGEDEGRGVGTTLSIGSCRSSSSGGCEVSIWSNATLAQKNDILSVA
jgi:hypothetical protein